MGPVVVADVTVPGEIVTVFAVFLAAFIAAAVGLFAWALQQVVRLTSGVAELASQLRGLSDRVDHHEDLLASHPEVRR